MGDKGELDFLLTNNTLDGVESVETFLEAMVDENVIIVDTPERGFESKEDKQARRSADRRLAKSRAAGRMVSHSRSWMVKAIKDAVISDELHRASDMVGVEQPSEFISRWYDLVGMDKVLTGYQQSLLKSFVNEVLPVLKRFNLDVSESVSEMLVDDSGGIAIPDKIRAAIKLFNSAESKSGFVDEDTAKYVADALNDDKVSSASMRRDVEERTGKGPSVKLTVWCETLFDGKRRYTIDTNDTQGEIFERAIKPIAECRFK